MTARWLLQYAAIINLTFDVQMTSRRCTFIQLSHATMCPLYVSPFFSSSSCSNSPVHQRMPPYSGPQSS